MLSPELVFVESPPDRVFLDVQDELRITRLKLHDVGLDDRWDRVAARSHAGAVDLVARIDERDRPHHAAAVAGIDMELFAEALERDLEILDDRVALLLRGEGFLAGALDRVLEEVVQPSDAGGLLLFEQLLAAGGHEQRLHVALGLGEVEELTTVGLPPHLDDLPRLVEADVRETAGWNIEVRIAILFRGGRHLVGESDDQSEGLEVDCRQRADSLRRTFRLRGHVGKNDRGGWGRSSSGILPAITAPRTHAERPPRMRFFSAHHRTGRTQGGRGRAGAKEPPDQHRTSSALPTARRRKCGGGRAAGGASSWRRDSLAAL